MYLTFFGLNEKPFAITPDPRYLYLSERHAEALAHLLYGINEAGGFVQLTGEVGTGKTTIVRSLLAQTPKNAEIALILNPRMTAPEFLLTICEELGIGVPDAAQQSLKDLVDILSEYLLRAHAAGTARGAGGGRGAEPFARRARAGAVAHQPRDQHPEAAADHPHRPAGATRAVVAQRAAAAGAAHHRPLSPDPAVARRDRGLRAPPPASRRGHERHLRAPGRSTRCSASRAACRA